MHAIRFLIHKHRGTLPRGLGKYPLRLRLSVIANISFFNTHRNWDHHVLNFDLDDRLGERPGGLYLYCISLVYAIAAGGLVVKGG